MTGSLHTASGFTLPHCTASSGNFNSQSSWVAQPQPSEEQRNLGRGKNCPLELTEVLNRGGRSEQAGPCLYSHGRAEEGTGSALCCWTPVSSCLMELISSLLLPHFPSATMCSLWPALLKAERSRQLRASSGEGKL